jgi:hypothetical protein
LCCTFSFIHLARCAAAIFLRADADMVRLGFLLPAWTFAALFAHRAFCARLIRFRPVCQELKEQHQHV